MAVVSLVDLGCDVDVERLLQDWGRLRRQDYYHRQPLGYSKVNVISPDFGLGGNGDWEIDDVPDNVKWVDRLIRQMSPYVQFILGVTYIVFWDSKKIERVKRIQRAFPEDKYSAQKHRILLDNIHKNIAGYLTGINQVLLGGVGEHG